MTELCKTKLFVMQIRTSTLRQYSIIFTFIWIGFVGAISFMEAWLKFQAPGITTELGLGIGQLVFGALNKVEITCALVILGILYYSRVTSKSLVITPYFLIAILLLVLQTLWLLPALDERASLIIQGLPVPESSLHLIYVIAEIGKVVVLFIHGRYVLKH